MAQLLSGLGHIPAVGILGFVFVWLAAESCGLPLPNEIVLLLAGSIAAQQHSGSLPVALIVVATMGSLLGAAAAYTIGQRGGRAAVLRYGRYIRLDQARLDSVEAWFARTGAVAIFITRITPFVRTVASFPAGMLRMPRRQFFLASAAGSLLWCVVMVSLGNALGANYEVALRLIEQYTPIAVVVLVGLVAAYFWVHRRLSQVGERPPNPTDEAELRSREGK
jgi:membrane protein DedA with SNARE-associated domain